MTATYIRKQFEFFIAKTPYRKITTPKKKKKEKKGKKNFKCAMNLLAKTANSSHLKTY